ncbi:hypothetical protein [Burkholderia singularis]|uniref:hypothetical protein n=1 Tax=Burkholderia singularis TaxID=1503053 RepID=UPI000AC41C64|nr:hypothetical protein [Burkholderia singularis]
MLVSHLQKTIAKGGEPRLTSASLPLIDQVAGQVKVHLLHLKMTCCLCFVSDS